MSVATKPAIIPFSAFPIIRPDATFLIDHLVGKSEQFFRNFDTRHLRGFEVDHELEFRWLQDCFLDIPRLRSVRLGGTVEGALLLQCERHNCLHVPCERHNGVRHIIEGNTEYNEYSWPICGGTWNAIDGWTSNSGLNPTVASWAIAAEAKMSIDPCPYRKPKTAD
jgi:hypothetical protein